MFVFLQYAILALNLYPHNILADVLCRVRLIFVFSYCYQVN